MISYNSCPGYEVQLAQSFVISMCWKWLSMTAENDKVYDASHKPSSDGNRVIAASFADSNAYEVAYKY